MKSNVPAAILWLLLVNISQAAENRIAQRIHGIDVTLSAMDGWVLNTAIYPKGESIVLSLPKGPTGGTPRFPQISIRAMKPEKDMSLNDMKSTWAADRRLVMPPKIHKSGDRDYLEAAGKGETVYDFADGGSTTGTSVSHILVFIESGVIYSCELSANNDSYDSHNIAELHKACESLEIGGS